MTKTKYFNKNKQKITFLENIPGEAGDKHQVHPQVSHEELPAK